MPIFASADEVYDAIGGMFRDALHEPGIGDELAASGVVLELRMTDPASIITIDMPNRAVHCGEPADTGAPEPSMTLRAAADTAHQYWMGELNVSVAIAKGKIRVRGPVPTLLRLAGLAKPLYPRYRQRMAATIGGHP